MENPSVEVKNGTLSQEKRLINARRRETMWRRVTWGEEDAHRGMQSHEIERKNTPQSRDGEGMHVCGIAESSDRLWGVKRDRKDVARRKHFTVETRGSWVMKIVTPGESCRLGVTSPAWWFYIEARDEGESKGYVWRAIKNLQHRRPTELRWLGGVRACSSRHAQKMPTMWMKAIEVDCR